MFIGGVWLTDELESILYVSSASFCFGRCDLLGCKGFGRSLW